MTNKEIHERRKELEAQADSARRSYYPAIQAQQAAEGESRAAKGALANALVDEAKGLEVDVDTAQVREADADMGLQHAKARVGAAKRAQEESTRNLSEYLAEHFDVFGEDALKLSVRAEEALQKANRAVMLADNLWKGAVSAWAPLCAAKSVAGVPPFPLSAASPIPARPPAVKVDRDAPA